MNATIPELIEKHLNATLTAGEAATLAQAMIENPALAEEFAAATRLEAALSTSMKDKERTALYTRRMERAAAETEPARTRRPWPVKSLTAAAGIAALIGIGWRLTEGEPAGKLQVKRGPASSTPGNTGGETSHAASGGTRIADASSMKRKLQRFASTTNRLRSVPVSQALAALRSEWAGYAHREAKDKDAVFVVADAVRQQWPRPEDEPSVSLEIPGISLLTSLELIAAQAGLKTTVTAAGVSLDPETRRDDDKPRKWTIPLSVASVSTFMREVSSGSAGIASNSPPDFVTWELPSLAGMARAVRPSWMEMPEIAQVYGGNIYSFTGEYTNGDINTWEDIGQANNTSDSFVIQTDYVIKLDSAIQTEAEIALGNRMYLDLTSSGGGQLNADGTISPAGSSFPVTPSIPLTFNEDGTIIDLSIAPEIIEFEGFINYGEPIQTTGINALGQSEPVILTDSGITQPVFATRVLPEHSANLTRLLIAHGMPADGATWDQESGVVTARGAFSQLRAAQAAAAAIQEAASAGVTVEMKVIEWKNGIPAPEADRSGLLPPPVTGQSDIISAEAASDLLGDPDLECVHGNKGTQHLGMPFTLRQTKRFGFDEASGVAHRHDAGVIVDAREITVSGFSWRLPVKIRSEAIIGREKNDDDGVPVSASLEAQIDLQLQDGEWVRVDFPASGEAKAKTVLLGIQATTMP